MTSTFCWESYDTCVRSDSKKFFDFFFFSEGVAALICVCIFSCLEKAKAVLSLSMKLDVVIVTAEGVDDGHQS